MYVYVVRSDVAIKRVFYGDNNSDINVYIRELILSNKDRNLQILFLVNSRKSLPHVGASGSSPENSFDEIYLRIIYLGQKSFHFHNNDVMKMTVIVDDARTRRKRINMSSDFGSGACAHLLLPL